MGRSLGSRAKVVGPALGVGVALSALAASGGPMGWGPVERLEVWASVLAGPLAGLWVGHDWGPADALGWAVACLAAVAAHPARAGWATGAVSAAGVGLWVLLGLVLTFDGV